jgi:hypothetical protein
VKQKQKTSSSMAEILKKLFGFGQKEETTKKAVTTDKVPDGGGGFSVKVAVPANSTTIHAAAPVVAQCYGNGGIQVFFLVTLKILQDLIPLFWRCKCFHMFLQIILLLPSVLAPVVLLCCGNGGIQISSSL